MLIEIFWYPDDDIVFCITLPALAATQLSAVQWFSCVELTSTSPWQYSPTKWTFGSQNTHWICRHVCASDNTHINSQKRTDEHTSLGRATMLFETKGQMADNNIMPELARWLKYAFLCVCVCMNMSLHISPRCCALPHSRSVYFTWPVSVSQQSKVFCQKLL